MLTREPLHVAFVWHMHQPYYRSSPTGPFHMPWARLHALKDYATMVELLADYPDLHQTFNLVPSLVEQLETYATGSFQDLYWDLTLKPAEELEPQERAFVVERMCEASSYPRASRHPRYLQLVHKRDSHAPDWQTCSAAFTVQELRDLQVLFNLAWFPPAALEAEPLKDLVARGGGFDEADKATLGQVQAEILRRVLPLYKEAAQRGQIELSTSPYFHPILPLLVNSDLARVAAADTILPRRRFAHPEDAWEQIELGIAKHVAVFGEHPRGMWCPEQAVGEDVLPLLARAGITWTVSDELVLSRSLSGTAGRALGSVADLVAASKQAAAQTDPAAQTDRAAQTDLAAHTGLAAQPFPPAPGAPLAPALLYDALRLPRDESELHIVFRDHTLSDLIGFTYQSWSPQEAAADLLNRLRAIAREPDARLVTIALDGENPWDYYQRNGEDFLRYLYEGLQADPLLRCVTISEHLRESPPARTLSWLHTGSWIGADLRTWSGDPAHNQAWDLLHDVRDVVASRREAGTEPAMAETAWHHVLVAEGSDWFWWFGIHHHTELDHVWDQEFRHHLQEALRLAGEPVPARLLLPLLDAEDPLRPLAPRGKAEPTVDGLVTESDQWDKAGRMAERTAATMQRAGSRLLREVRFALDRGALWLLLLPENDRAWTSLPEARLHNLTVDITLRTLDDRVLTNVHLPLRETALGPTNRGGGPAAPPDEPAQGGAAVPPEEPSQSGRPTADSHEPPPARAAADGGPAIEPGVVVATREVVEIFVPLEEDLVPTDLALGLELRLGGRPDLEQVFDTRGLSSLGWTGMSGQ
jgi:alpha-amylase/alpha-mannosidase (GH57 family)